MAVRVRVGAPDRRQVLVRVLLHRRMWPVPGGSGWCGLPQELQPRPEMYAVAPQVG